MKKKLITLAIALLAVAIVLAGLATFWTEYEWFVQLGFGTVFSTTLMAKLGSAIGFGLLALAVLGVHVHFIRRLSKPRKSWTIPTAEGGEVDIKDVVKKVTTPLVVAAALVVAVIMGYWAARHWEDLLKLLHQTPFGKTEPILGRDIGFYLFVLPSLEFTQEWLVYLMGISTIFCAAVYVSRGAITVEGRVPLMSRGVRGHLLASLAVVVLVIAWGFRVEMYEILFSKRGVAYGATYTDVNANLISYRVLIAGCVAVALYLLARIGSKKEGKAAIKGPAIALGVVAGLYVLGVFVWPTVVQQLVVNPNELDKERPYLVHAIAGTRDAYDLNRIAVQEYPANENLTVADLKKNQLTMDNVKIWDHRPLKATYRQLQVIRLYYDFPNISVDRYSIGDRVWQVMLSARELVYEQLPVSSQTWVNRHLQYTHGYGVCLSPVTQAVGEGLPDLWIKDIPPETRFPELKIARPEIYYGLKTEDYSLVKTTTQEFDYPSGADNRYTTYQGSGGVGIGSFFRRLLFAIRFMDPNLVFTSHLTPESRILFNRQIQERINTVAPFLMLDQEPYMVVAEGRLFWIQDAYTISYRYPYSQPTSLGKRARINYIRNAVKVVVDAYNGSLAFYLWDDKDPMIQTYRKIFPSMFKSSAEMPKAIRAHVRYPQDLFAVQATMYESFHMTDPRVFYNQEDKWAISRELTEKTAGRREASKMDVGGTARHVTDTNRMAPYYMIMRLPEEKREEFLLMVPFTPTNKDNMVAWMSASCDGDQYGKLRVYTFPKKKMIFGPMQVEARIDQDDFISQWITLRNQQGSTVLRGDLLVIPIEDSILYVEPVYLQATQTQLPELKQVIVSFGKHLSMKGSLDAALKDVFGLKQGGAAITTGAPGSATPVAPVATSTTQPASGAPEGVSELARRALLHYRAGQKKLAQEDWAGYGAEQKQLKEALEALARGLEGKLKPGTPSEAAPKK
ncbi:MAG: UPF0182 family protein [Deltaproteobacteria bacterium]|nr:UPF0182 family protein [Deltaproteobacteria bacterium]